MKNVFIKIIDLARRVVKWDKKEKIYSNGIDNLYPDRVELFKANSVTAKMASNKMKQFLVGGGFEGVENIIINKEHRIKLFQFIVSCAQSLVDHKGFFVWVKYNPNFKIASMKPIPFRCCRIGLKDDNEYNGKIYYKKDWSDKKEEPIIIDVFNPDPNVIKSQIDAAGNLNKYKGQIYFFNQEVENYYPTSRIDAVMHDCDSEHQSSIYKNRLLRRGFFGKTIFMTRPLIDGDIPKQIMGKDGVMCLNKEYNEMESEAQNIRNQIQEFLGAENSGGVMHIEADFDGEKMEEWFAVKNIESKINPNLFINVEKSLEENICMAYNNIPIGLIRSSESVFGNSGATIRAMEDQYWKQTSDDRTDLVMSINEILKHHYLLEANLTIKKFDNASTTNNA